MKKNLNIYIKLFTSTFYLSTFTFGGGFVIVPLMKKKFVDDLKWIEEKEMLNLAAIAQSSPGAVAVNASILLGYQIAGVVGAGTAILGTVLPPLIILTGISAFYNAFRQSDPVSALLRGMQAGVAAVIADVVLQMGGSILKSKKLLSLVIMAATFIAAFYLKVNVVFILLVCAGIGVFTTFYKGKRHTPAASSQLEKRNESEAGTT